MGTEIMPFEQFKQNMGLSLKEQSTFNLLIVLSTLIMASTAILQVYPNDWAKIITTCIISIIILAIIFIGIKLIYGNYKLRNKYVKNKPLRITFSPSDFE
jgi:hypothetical protein